MWSWSCAVILRRAAGTWPAVDKLQLTSCNVPVSGRASNPSCDEIDHPRRNYTNQSGLSHTLLLSPTASTIASTGFLRMSIISDRLAGDTHTHTHTHTGRNNGWSEGSMNARRKEPPGRAVRVAFKYNVQCGWIWPRSKLVPRLWL